MNPNLIIPVGTQIVSRIEAKDKSDRVLCVQGAVGVIIKAPTDNSHAYKVKLANDAEVILRRHEFSIRKHYQKQGLQYAGDVLAELNLYDYVIYCCVVGSRAFGLDNADSDTDIRGIYLPPADIHWSLYGVPEQLENKEKQECYWELQKFIILALKANPNILECLYTPIVEKKTAIAKELSSRTKLNRTVLSFVKSERRRDLVSGFCPLTLKIDEMTIDRFFFIIKKQYKNQNIFY